MATPVNKIGCRVCDSLPPGDLVDLDALMGDASRWPETVWGIFDPPKGKLGPLRLRFGARNVAKAWLLEHGYADAFTDRQINTHYRHVPLVAVALEDLLTRGLVRADPGNGPGSGPSSVDAINPTAFLTYFSRGIELGNKGLDLMAKRVQKMVDANEDVPFLVLKQLIDNGAKLAVTQAQLKQRGLSMGDEPDEDEGFRAGSQPLPSQRMGHHRIRTVEGVDRPVTDEGPADREHFSERSIAEGGSGLPH